MSSDRTSRGFRNRLCIVAGLACGVALAGCGRSGESDRLPMSPVSGTVLVKGMPAAGIHVVLHPKPGSPAAAANATPSATTGGDGTFLLSTYEQNDGAAAGAYDVTLQWYQDGGAKAKGPGRISGFAPRTDSFGGKFRDPNKSPWHVTITEGENVLKPIDVE